METNSRSVTAVSERGLFSDVNDMIPENYGQSGW